MNWWLMRLATSTDAGGRPRVDPVALAQAQRTPFAHLLEMHMAQDALDEMADIRRQQAEDEVG